MAISKIEIVLLNGVTAISNGAWVSVNSLDNKIIHIKGITNATVQIRGSCAPTKPADATHEIQIGSDITADGLFEITAPLKWLKAMVSAYVSGTIYAYLAGREA